MPAPSYYDNEDVGYDYGPEDGDDGPEADDEDEVDFEGRDDDDLSDGTSFADPGGNSALRAATASNPRNLPCPDCGRPDRLTPADVARGYCCDTCADRNERGGY